MVFNLILVAVSIYRGKPGRDCSTIRNTEAAFGSRDHWLHSAARSDVPKNRFGELRCLRYFIAIGVFPLAALLCERISSAEKVRFTNSGTEAVMMAVKAARAHTLRPKIAKAEGAYHDSYDYVEVSEDSTPDNWGDPEPNSIPYCAGTPSGALDDVVVLPFNNAALAEKILRRNATSLAAITG